MKKNLSNPPDSSHFKRNKKKLIQSAAVVIKNKTRTTRQGKTLQNILSNGLSGTAASEQCFFLRTRSFSKPEGQSLGPCVGVNTYGSSGRAERAVVIGHVGSPVEQSLRGLGDVL